MPKVSVIIPVKDAALHLGECLDSVLAQSCPDLEVVCVENGSHDSSPAILAAYAAKDARVRVLCDHSGQGAGAARNVGMAAATGKWLHFVDADDIVPCRAEAAIVSFAESQNADVVVFGAEEYDNLTGLTTPLPLDLAVAPSDKAFLKSYATCPWNKLFRRSFIEDAGIVFQKIPRSNDLAFTVEALCRARRIAVLNQTLYRYRIHAGGLQETKAATPGVWREALAEARRRLEAAGIFDDCKDAFELLAEDVRLSNMESLPARIFASVKRRGMVAFLKHALGYVWGRMVPR